MSQFEILEIKKNDSETMGVVLGMGEKKTILIIGSGKSRVRLGGEGAEALVLGVVVGKADETQELNLEVIHDAPKTKAEVILKGVVFDRAKVNIRGSVVINKGARLTDDSLREDLLLVGEKAKGETYPYLEIEENDVLAKHAATVGRVDEEQLFYLASRGISTRVGEAMLVEGFFESIFGRLPEIQRDIIKKRINI